MQKRDLTSVIIPCFNQAKFLGEALESVFAQTYPHYEVIVVDDGSTDGTAKVAARFDPVRTLRQRNRGLAAARNAGFRASAGRFVVFLDADDRLLPNALEDGVASLDANPLCAFSYGHVKLIATDGSPLPTPLQVGVAADHYLELLRRNYIWTTGAVVYRRTAFESVGGFNALISGSSDFDLNARMARLFPVCCSESVVVEYRRHDEGMSRDYALMLQTAITARRLQWKLVKGRTMYEEALKAGIRHSQEHYGEKLISRVHSQWRKHQCEALRGLLVLLRYYPQGLIKRARRKLNRVALNVQH
jgi:glycosyltransferase involved in cell wall biosynthesis